MATRGRKPKPEGIKKLGGRSHKKKQPPLIELPLDADCTESFMDIPGEKELWDSLVTMNVAKRSDRRAFGRYIDLLGIYKEALADVMERGVVLNKGMSGERYNPSWRVMRDAQSELLKLEAEFGLTPSAKQRVMKSADDKGGGGDGGYAALRGRAS